MLWGYIFLFLFLGAVGYVIRKGSRAHIQAIGIMIFGVAATTIIYTIGSHKWLPLNIAVSMIDMIALMLFGLIAHQSKEFWPLLLTGWQLATIVIHIATLYTQNLVPDVYGTVQGIWAYLQFTTIFISALLEHRKAMRAS